MLRAEMMDDENFGRISDDGDPADLPHGALAHLPSLGDFESSSESDDANSRGGASSDGCTPKRAGATPDAAPSQRPHTDSQSVQGVEGEEFRVRHTFPAVAPSGTSLLVTDRDAQRATMFPAIDRLSHEVLFPMREQARSVDHPVATQ